MQAKDHVLQLLHEFHALSAQDCIRELRRQGHSYNKTSVYRALDTLLEAGKICRLALDKDQFLYELRENHHAHLVCTKCGMVGATDCEVEQPKEIQDFSIDHHHLTFFGTCEACRRNSTK